MCALRASLATLLCIYSRVLWSGPTDIGSNNEGISPADDAISLSDAADKGYRQTAIKSLLAEANQIALELHLNEHLPLREEDLIEKYVSPPRLAHRTGGIGNVTTSNYVYCVPKSEKFMFLIGTHQREDCINWEKKYTLPATLINTNEAYALVTNWLRILSVDVDRLNRDYRLVVEPDRTCVRVPVEKFIPLYWIVWSKRERQSPDIIVSRSSGWEPVASVLVFTPTKTLVQLRIEDPDYINRKPIRLSAGSQ